MKVKADGLHLRADGTIGVEVADGEILVRFDPDQLRALADGCVMVAEALEKTAAIAADKAIAKASERLQ